MTETNFREILVATARASYSNYNYIGYIMFSAQGTGDGVVVTKNEEIL